MLPKQLQKKGVEYVCENCEYTCSNLTNFNKHLLTIKHITRQCSGNAPISCIEYYCECGLTYKHRQSFNRHKKSCSYTVPEPPVCADDDVSGPGPVPVPAPAPAPSQFDASLVIELLKQNHDFKEIMLEQSKQMAEQQTQMAEHQNQLLEAVKDGKLGNTNYTNNTFNINMFLNETCKDAMNLMEFVQTLQYSIENLDYVGQNGYVAGISKLIVDGLNGMDVAKRPIHCTDAKRDSLYLKDADEWTKETADMKNMKRAIKHVSHNNLKKLCDWKTVNLGTEPPQDGKRDVYLKIASNAMGGGNDKEDDANMRHIVHKIALATAIEKIPAAAAASSSIAVGGQKQVPSQVQQAQAQK